MLPHKVYHIISYHLILSSSLVGWIRELTREGIEPNPGPAFSELAKWLRESFAEDWDRNAEDKLQELKLAVRSKVGNGFFGTDEVKKFFDNYPEEARVLNIPFGNMILDYIRTHTGIFYSTIPFIYYG